MRKEYTLIIFLFFWSMSMTRAQVHTFVYPQMPDSLSTVEKRLTYLALHYWDQFDFSDTLQLNNPDIAEQGFVNYIDLLPRFKQETAQASLRLFSSKAFATEISKNKFESLIDHYLDDPQSPMRNDKTYLLFLNEMKNSSSFDETEKERINFLIKTRNKNLPGDKAIDIAFSDKEGNTHHLRDYQNRKVILYFYDPNCDNCHRVSAWLDKQIIPAEYTVLPIHANTHISDIYSLEAMPTIYLLDKGNIVVLKDCTPELLIATINQK